MIEREFTPQSKLKTEIHYNLSIYIVDKDVFISDVLGSQQNGEARCWNLSFHRNFRDWELGDVLSFFNLIYSLVPRGRGWIG